MMQSWGFGADKKFLDGDGGYLSTLACVEWVYCYLFQLFCACLDFAPGLSSGRWRQQLMLRFLSHQRRRGQALHVAKVV